MSSNLDWQRHNTNGLVPDGIIWEDLEELDEVYDLIILSDLKDGRVRECSLVAYSSYSVRVSIPAPIENFQFYSLDPNSNVCFQYLTAESANIRLRYSCHGYSRKSGSPGGARLLSFHVKTGRKQTCILMNCYIS